MHTIDGSMTQVADWSGAHAEEALRFVGKDNVLFLFGSIDETSPAAFDDAMKSHPDAHTMVFDFVPGSYDDNANIALAGRVRDAQLESFLPANGLVASGGTDLFLAGVNRRIQRGACVGVHTWGDEEMGAGADVPQDDPAHQLYLDYYQSVGIDSDFYWYTLQAAGVNDAHWMSEEEIQKYRIGELVGKSRNAAGKTCTICDKRFNEGF